MLYADSRISMLMNLPKNNATHNGRKIKVNITININQVSFFFLFVYHYNIHFHQYNFYFHNAINCFYGFHHVIYPFRFVNTFSDFSYFMVD